MTTKIFVTITYTFDLCVIASILEQSTSKPSPSKPSPLAFYKSLQLWLPQVWVLPNLNSTQFVLIVERRIVFHAVKVVKKQNQNKIANHNQNQNSEAPTKGVRAQEYLRWAIYDMNIDWWSTCLIVP